MQGNQFSASRRYSPMKYTKSTQERQQAYSPCKISPDSKLTNQRYLCHYSNALYMGGMNCFKKHGYGIMLMDTGACAITCHSFDNVAGYGLVFRDKSLTSVAIRSSKVKAVCYRTGPYLLSFEQNHRGYVDGVGYFVDFRERTLCKVTFYQSAVQRKQLIKNVAMLDKIFNKHDYSDITGDHKQAKHLRLQVDVGDEIHCVRNEGNVSVGFMSKNQKSNKHESNGLIFRVEVDQTPDRFDVMLKERGYFVREKIQNFGEKHFENGNYYIGGFKDGMFQGQGMLIQPQQQKWTVGIYRKGELIDILQSSINNSCKTSEMVRKMHERYDNYIDMHIKLSPSDLQLRTIVKNVREAKLYPDAIEDPNQQMRKRKEALKSIHDDYVSGKYYNNTEQLIKKQLDSSSKKKYRTYVDVDRQSRTPTKLKTHVQNNREEISNKKTPTRSAKKLLKNHKSIIFSPIEDQDEIRKTHKFPRTFQPQKIPRNLKVQTSFNNNDLNNKQLKTSANSLATPGGQTRNPVSMFVPSPHRSEHLYKNEYESSGAPYHGATHIFQSHQRAGMGHRNMQAGHREGYRTSRQAEEYQVRLGDSRGRRYKYYDGEEERD